MENGKKTDKNVYSGKIYKLVGEYLVLMTHKMAKNGNVFPPNLTGLDKSNKKEQEK